MQIKSRNDIKKSLAMGIKGLKSPSKTLKNTLNSDIETPEARKSYSKVLNSKNNEDNKTPQGGYKSFIDNDKSR